MMKVFEEKKKWMKKYFKALQLLLDRIGVKERERAFKEKGIFRWMVNFHFLEYFLIWYNHEWKKEGDDKTKITRTFQVNNKG